MLVNPAPGALVRDPATKRAIERGADVDQNDPYWSRLIIDGDIVAAPPPPAPRKGAAGSSDEGNN